MKEIILKQDESVASNIDYVNELNAEQLAVVEQGNGPCLVLAGAGSGKTRTITYRVAYLLERGVLPQNILLLTFTNKASKEMLARVETLLGAYPTGLWGGTFHSVANRILRQYAELVGATSHFSILDTEDSESLLKVCVKESGVDTTDRKFPSAAKLHSIFSYARNAGRTIADVVEQNHGHFFELISVMQRIQDAYETHKRQADAMDFDDLLIRFRDLLVQNPLVRDRLATQFIYVLVDEYQDTNVLQAELITLLASVHHNILVVGDDAQSIYSFRAADIKNILSFPDRYARTKTFRLTDNYRSSPEILAIANETIGNNKHQFKKVLSSRRASTEKPFLISAPTTTQEAQYIAQQILTLKKNGISSGEIAVLFRAAFHSQALEFELMRRDIAYEYRGGMKFFERAHVKDVLAYVRINANPKDEAAWMRVLGLQAGIGLVTAQKIITQICLCDSFAQVTETKISGGVKAVLGWNRLIITLKKFSKEISPAQIIRIVLASDYRQVLEAEYPDFMDRLEDLEQFAVFAGNYSDIISFLTDVSLTSDYGAMEEDTQEIENRIILSTVHQAKGLEWDAVFVMNLVDGKFPNGKALNERNGLEEERRLFYVATTRARQFLYYTFPLISARLPDGQSTESLLYNQPSMFLQELDPVLLQKLKLKNEIIKTTSWNRSAWNNSDDGPTIVLDEMGEEVKKKSVKPVGSFLRDV